MQEYGRMDELSIVILSHNRLDCINGHWTALLETCDLHGAEVIVVDNASTDGSIEVLKALRTKYSAMKLCLNASNSGVGAGRNAGYKLATRQFIVSLDDDAEISCRDLAKIPDIFDELTDSGILAFKIFDVVKHSYLNDFGQKRCLVANFAGAGQAFRATLFAKIGYLDELCTFGGEEFDMSVRAFSAGFTTVYLPEVIVTHHSVVRQLTEQQDRRVKWLYNFVRIYFSHFPVGMATVLTMRSLASHLVSGHQKFGLAIFFPLLRSVWVGMQDGVKGRKLVSSDTVRFYSSNTLEPQFGNVSLSSKVVAKFSGRLVK